MLKQTIALGMRPLYKNCTIDDQILNYKQEFNQELIRIFDKVKNDKSNSYKISSLDNYTLFNNMYCDHKSINYNNKNIIFETVDSSLPECFRCYLDSLKNPSQNDYNCDCKLNGTLYDISEYMSFFGLGEFPFLKFTIVRIGNQDYSFYEIVR